MAEPVTTAVSTAVEIAKVSVPPVIRFARKFFCLDDNVKKLRDNMNNWRCGNDTWVKEAQDVLDEVEQNSARLHGWCPSCILKYRLNNQIEELHIRMSQFNNSNGNFQTPLSNMAYFSSKNFMESESTKKAYKQLLESLKNNEVSKIGLYGMGGCGKTTLVNLLRQEAVKKLSMKVVFVVVSNRVDLDISGVQERIASSLNLPLMEQDKLSRADRLRGRLSVGKKVLLILDDVWESLNLEDIGIPDGCNILLTTRYGSVCTEMNCQTVFLDLLNEEEAWSLFQNHASLTDDTRDLARDIVKECSKLPLAVASVARTLNRKSKVVWIEALHSLRECKATTIAGGLKELYVSLRLSYDKLGHEEAKKVFLLCSLFPEDSEIFLEVLIRFAFGLGLFEDVPYERYRTKVGSAIEALVNTSLLIQGTEGEFVKMHDAVHDVALTIAKEDNQEIKQAGKDLKKLAKCAAMKDLTRLYFHKINELPDELDYPKLEVLFVDWDGDCSPKVSNAFFEKTKELKVFSVIDRYKTSWKTSTLLLPQSTHLKSLQTLCLEKCILDNVSFLGNLDTLGTLELRDCTIAVVPGEIGKLQNLRLLDVSRCIIEGEGNPYEVVGGCLRLEELYFLENDISKSVLNHKNLVGFFREVGSSSEDGELKRFHLQIGSHIDHLMDDLTQKSKFISISQSSLEASNLNTTIKKLVQGAQVLLLSQIKQGCKAIIPDMVQTGEGMNELTELVLLNSEAIECLINSISTDPAFSKLAKLRIEDMHSLEDLNRGQPQPTRLFGELKELMIKKCSQLQGMLFAPNLNLGTLKDLILENCPKLTSLFTPAAARSLVMLEKLQITECNGLKQIIVEEREDIRADNKDRKSYFKSLKELVIIRCKQLTYLIPVSFALGLLQLERLEIIDAPELNYVFGPDDQNKTQNLAKRKNKEPQIIELPLLKVLQLVNLSNATGICPEKYHPKWPLSSTEVSPSNCPHLVIPGLDLIPKKKHHTLQSGCLWRNSDWIMRYCLGKQTAKKIDAITELKQMARLASLPSLKYNSDNVTIFGSIESAYDKLLEALQDDEVSMIGLYGMGGCGKTTLAKEVATQAKLLFNKVVFVVFSSSASIRTIQGRIASSLGLELNEEDLLERAKCLFTRLTAGERILLILDGVREMFDLETTGIPSGYSHNGCVVLLTTRDRHVCTMMNCQTIIELRPLAEEDAWALFQERAGLTDHDDSDSFKAVAQEITRVCKGLPIAIVAVAYSLKGRAMEEWKSALKNLRGSTLIDGDLYYSSLIVSYNSLKDEEAQKLFLFCSLFEEDSKIPMESLIRYGIALDLFGEAESYEIARVRALAIIDKLIGSCLLLRGEEKHFVKMHDLSREVALQIAMIENQEILSNEIDPTRMQHPRYLLCRSINEIPIQLDSSKLEVLIVSGDDEDSIVNRDDQGSIDELAVPLLRVFVLENKGSIEKPIQVLPKSVLFSTTLRCLLLDGWKLGDISFVENLRALDSLTLRNCSFMQLPHGVIQLRMLRLLDLSRCEIIMNPFEVMGRCSQLEELYFIENQGEWEHDRQNVATFYEITSRLKRYNINTRAFRADQSISSALDQTIGSPNLIENFEETLEPTVLEGSKLEKVTIAALSTDSEASNPSPELLAIHQQSGHPLALVGKEASVESTAMNQQITQGSFHECLFSEKNNKLTSAIYSESGTSLPSPSFNSTHISSISTSEEVDSPSRLEPSSSMSSPSVVTIQKTFPMDMVSQAKTYNDEVTITALLADSEGSNSTLEPLAIHQQSGTPLELVGKEVSIETTTMDQQITQGSFQESQSSEKDNKTTSSIYSESGTSLPIPSVNSTQESINEPHSTEQELRGNEKMNHTPQRVDKSSDLIQSPKEATNERDCKEELNKTAPATSPTISGLKDSTQTTSFTSSEKASPMISSIPTSQEVHTVTSPSQLEPSSSSLSHSVVTIHKKFPQNMVSQAKTCNDEDTKANPITLRELKGAIISLFEFMEEDFDDKIPAVHSVSTVPTNHPAPKIGRLLRLLLTWKPS